MLLKEPPKEKFDVCIIGAGAAGITMALELSKKNVRTILIESGNQEINDELRREYSGKLEICEGDKILSTIGGYQYESRLRRLGGSTGHWANYTRHLDNMDFEVRPWVGEFRWPIGSFEMTKYYHKAHGICRTSPVHDDLEEMEFSEQLLAGMEPFVHQFYHANPFPVNFWIQYGHHLLARDSLAIMTDANLVKLDIQNYSVSRAKFKRWSGEEFHVEANQFVLAMGGIENTRHLLLNKGNIVGMYKRPLGKNFMEHFHVDIGRFFLKDYPANGLPLYDFSSIQRRSVALALSPQEQVREGVLNGQIDLDPMPFNDEFKAMGAKPDQFCGRIRFIMEQLPQECNRIELSETERDHFGLQKTNIRMSFSEMQWKTISTFLTKFRETLGERGRVKPYIVGHYDPPQITRRLYMFGSHHMGTIPFVSGGPVDDDCKVRGTDNLFVAGSSVFPTVGHAPPTLTIVALAVRLAERLWG